MREFDFTRSDRFDPPPLAFLAAVVALVSAVGFVALTAGCNDHPVTTVSPGWQVYDEPGDASATTKLDLLWVIDNSGSMCQEQRALQKQFPHFVETLREQPIDLNVAVTTTDVSSKYSCKPVENPQIGEERFDGGPGCIQSRPRPATGFQSSCRYTEKEGTVYDGVNGRPGPEFGPVRKNLERARKCAADPGQWDHLKPENVDADLIRCAVEGDATACKNAPRPTDHIKCELDGDSDACDASARPSDGAFQIRDLFPPPGAYRDVPKVLRTADYTRDDGTIELDEFRRDFTCMSTVGTRGFAREQGLRALVRAVSPERTGGPADVDDPPNPDAPNHGFLRQDAHFGAVFVTDENDCTHDGSLEEPDPCGEARCYFPNKVGEDDPPMVKIEELYADFRKNLAASKGVESVADDKILLGTIHGGYEPYQSVASRPESCQQWADENNATIKDIPPTTCDSKFGETRSGDRYEEFLRQGERFFPELQATGSVSGKHMPGKLCTSGGLREAFEQMGRFFHPGGAACIQQDLPTCGNAEECPEAIYEVGGPICTDAPVDDGGLCRSAVQVRLVAPDALGEPERKLRESGFCIDTSLEETTEGIECVVRPTLYEWTECPGGEGVSYRWKSPAETGDLTRQVGRRLADFELHIRYLGRPDSHSGTSR